MKILLGLWCIFWARSSRVSLPRSTASSMRGSIVSSPGKPGGAPGPRFSSTVWGAWSVAMQSITSKFSQRASRSSFDTRCGLTCGKGGAVNSFRI